MDKMEETRRLIDTLKKALKTRGITYAELAQQLGLSEASIKRLFSQQTFSLRRLEAICALLDLSLHDLTRMARLSERDAATTLTLDQEASLADNPLLLAYFYLLLNGWRAARIAGHFNIEKPQHTQVLANLDKLGLIRLMPRNQVVLNTNRTINWLPDGPIRARYETEVIEQFLQGDFAGSQNKRVFMSAELSPASAAIISRKLKKLIAEFDELAELDLSLPAAEKAGVGVLLAQRPWAFWSLILDAAPGPRGSRNA